MRVRDARTNAEIIAETELDYEYVRSWSNEQTRLRIPSTVLSKVNATGVKDKSTSGVSGVRYDYQVHPPLVLLSGLRTQSEEDFQQPLAFVAGELLANVNKSPSGGLRQY